MKKLLCIVSTGRSGTSVLSNIANVINFNLSDYLMGAHPTNRKGHFEDVILMDRNEHFLQTAGKNIWTTQKFSDDENNFFKVKYQPEIVNYLNQLLNVKQKLVIKEPRISKLFHLYRNLFDEIDAEKYFLFLYRSPLLYTKSTIKAYNNIDLKKGAKVWFFNNYTALTNFRQGDKVYFLNFSDFIKDIPNYTKKLANFVDENVNHVKFIEYFSDFYDKSLVSFKNDDICGIDYADQLFEFIENINEYDYDHKMKKLGEWNLDEILNKE